MYKLRALIIVDTLDIVALDFRQLLDSIGYTTELVSYDQVTLGLIALIQPNILFLHVSKQETLDNGILKVFQHENISGIPLVALTSQKEVASLMFEFATVVLLLPVSEEHLINLFSFLGSIDSDVAKSPWDRLTGFYVPSFFKTRLQQALDHSRKNDNNRFIVYTINLEHLFLSNQKNGLLHHQRILEGVAIVLRKLLRPMDIVSRFDDNQFLVLIDDATDRFAPATIAGRMHIEFEELLADIGLDGNTKIDIGILYCNPSYNSVDEILKDAQMSLQMARQDNLSSYKVFVRKRPNNNWSQYDPLARVN